MEDDTQSVQLLTMLSQMHPCTKLRWSLPRN